MAVARYVFPEGQHVCVHLCRYILSCHELYETPQCVWVVMEIIRGGELLDLLIEGGVYTEKDAARCMKQVFLAIRCAVVGAMLRPFQRSHSDDKAPLLVSGPAQTPLQDHQHSTTLLSPCL